MTANVQQLIKRGVILPDPASVYIDPEVNPEQIHSGTVLHPGCRIIGRETSIGPGCEIGEEAPVTLRDCQLDARVTLRGGFLRGATFLEGTDCGDGAHVRPGSLFEEYSRVAHTNGLKQTILMPFVTIGSLTNFCDVLMAGGTGLANHSEVGSSYVHFNYTPHQDKATPTLIGDVPRGVLLNQDPIFLGGQGGIVGPCRIAFGSVVAAGIVLRKDITQPNLLMRAAGGSQRVVLRPYHSALYGPVDRILENNIVFVGNLLALRAWYRHARTRFLGRTIWGEACLQGALARLDECFTERLQRLGQLAAKFAQSVKHAALQGQNTTLPPFPLQERFAASWSRLEEQLYKLYDDPAVPPEEVSVILRRMAIDQKRPFIQAVQFLREEDRPPITNWLDGIVNAAVQTFPI